MAFWHICDSWRVPGAIREYSERAFVAFALFQSLFRIAKLKLLLALCQVAKCVLGSRQRMTWGGVGQMKTKRDSKGGATDKVSERERGGESLSTTFQKL